MTDKDLIDMLRTKQICTGFKPDGFGDVNVVYGPDPVTAEAADRIEQLERELSISRMAQVVMDNSVAEVEALIAERERLTAIGTEMAESIEGNYYLPGVVRRWFIALSGETP